MEELHESISQNIARFLDVSTCCSLVCANKEWRHILETQHSQVQFHHKLFAIFERYVHKPELRNAYAKVVIHSDGQPDHDVYVIMDHGDLKLKFGRLSLRKATCKTEGFYAIANGVMKRMCRERIDEVIIWVKNRSPNGKVFRNLEASMRRLFDSEKREELYIYRFNMD